MKLLITLSLVFVLGAFNGYSQETTAPTTLFAQCMFDISDRTEMQALQTEINANPYVEMVRLDYNTQRALIMTHDLTELSIEDFKTWFGAHSGTVYCVNIGVRGVDQMKPYPFTNCD